MMPMKKNVVFLFLALLTMAGMAREVKSDVARQVAITYMRAQGMSSPTALADITSQTPFTEFYVFAAPEGGFVLVSADDCVRPILGYSTGNRFESKSMPAHVEGWLREYEAEIRHYRALEAAGSWQVSDEVAMQWRLLQQGEVPPMPLMTAMTDTLLTKWNQGQYYNMLCPVDNGHWTGHPYTGCVATAMTQVMKYWNFPQTGYSDHQYYHYNGDTSYGMLYANFGATTYQWNAMPPMLTYLSTGAEDTAVALLMYHAGVSLNMNYGITGSGAGTGNYGDYYSACTENSLVTYFKYSPALHSIYRGDFSFEEWNTRLRAELDAHRPILYSGNDVGTGHAFVLDGYNDDGYFHLNWGWGSYCDGYYPIGGLNPAPGGAGGNSTSAYNNNNVAIIGVQPNAHWGMGGTVTVMSADTTMGTVSESRSYEFDEYVWMRAYPNPGYQFKCWSDGHPVVQRYVHGTGGDYTFTAVFEPVGTDTIALYGAGTHITSFGNPSTGEITWGIKIDSSYMQLGRELHAVQIYVAYPGTYQMSVYLGVDNPSAQMYNTTFTVDSNEIDQWKTVVLNTPVVVDGWESMWISFYNNDVAYPACVTFYSGIDESLLFDNINKGEYYSQYSFLIRGLFRSTNTPPAPNVVVTGPIQISVGQNAIFHAMTNPGATIHWTLNGGSPATATGATATTVFNTAGTWHVTASITIATGSASSSWDIVVVDYTEGDTISYCLDRPQSINVGENTDTTRWGIMLPHDYLHGRDTLRDVLLYVARYGVYTLKVYQGGSDAPDQLVYTHDYPFYDEDMQYGFINCTPDVPVPIDTTRNLWITFEYPETEYPAMGCMYMGDPNSDWYAEDGVNWTHLTDLAPWLSTSWLIKAVTSKAEVVEPETYTVTVNCKLYDGTPVDTSHVTGAGSYPAGSTVNLEGLVSEGTISFDYWIVETGDTVRENPYVFVIDGDRNITAVFKEYGGIDDVDGVSIRIYPNPATDVVTIEGVADPASVTMIDVDGREVGRWQLTGGPSTLALPVVAQGTYFFHIVTDRATMVQKLVIK